MSINDATAGEALKPCPWCEPLKQQLIGGPTIVGYGEVRSPGELWHGLCQACGAEGPKEADPVAARAAWNRRPSADPAALEAARRIVKTVEDMEYGRISDATCFRIRQYNALIVARALLASTSLEDEPPTAR